MVIYLGLFQLAHLNLSILVIYPLKKIVVTKIFGLLVTNLSFSTSDNISLTIFFLGCGKSFETNFKMNLLIIFVKKN